MSGVRRLVLVRHGETTGQSSVRYYGATDVPLSALGEAQMRRAGAALAGEAFDAVYASRLQRARRGAALIAGAAHAPRPVAAFDEVSFGDWEGWTREEIARRAPAAFARWQADPERFVYPGGECRQAFHRRVAAGLAALLADPPGARLLLVAHRGVIAVALSELLGLDAAARRVLDIGLGSIHVLVRDGAGWRAERLNALDHLADVAEASA
ncbi:histidine phosphatase family protein [bacterium]|nr:histidine phosphatase family protein [bacterium]